MEYDNGTFIMYGVSRDDPRCIHTPRELIDTVNELGFLPLFRGSLPGFSVEERTESRYWWTDDARDPWMWRQILAAGGEVAYGKFFDKKAGFISKAWLPYFANARRDGYDFDARWDDEKASVRQKKLMDIFPEGTERFSYEAKQMAGFGKDGERNFEGTITELQMQTYLAIRDFRQRRNRRGEPYGWAIAVYAAPETIFGRELVTSAYGEAPETSRQRILDRLRQLCPDAREKELKKYL